MSWDTIASSTGYNQMKCGIFSHTGQKWGVSGDLAVTTHEVQIVAKHFDNLESCRRNGITLQGNLYKVVQANERSIYALRYGNNGCIAIKVKTAFVICCYEEMQPGEAVVRTEKIADYLIDQGY
mmetsp:Transcript_15606/g.17345  ORF Transcript_15606/g.17345 Transcript_15606/m.17345 type:complete len:124 (-) Transcript_15606:84-455(-)